MLRNFTMKPSVVLFSGAIAVLGPALAGCHGRAPEKSSEAPASEVFVLPGATDVQRRSGPGMTGVTYSLAARFPAADAIGAVLSRMERLGWTAEAEDALNPGIPTSVVRGWTSYIDARRSPRQRRYVWTGEWRNAAGELASCSFHYVVPENEGGKLDAMTVSASVASAEVARRLASEKKRLAESGRPNPQPKIDLPEGPMRVGLEARFGDCFLASNQLGDAVVQVTSPGSLVAYRWRARALDGTETAGEAPSSSRIQAGPFRLGWMPGFNGERGHVEYYPEQMDLLPLPSAEFGVDLADVRRLASLTPRRDERYRGFVLPPQQAAHDRTGALLLAAQTAPVASGEAFVVSGAKGRGVVIVEDSTMHSIRYRWRFRATANSMEEAGSAENAEKPLPAIHVGPYSLLWEIRQQSGYREGNGPVTRSWQALVRYLPEEMSVTVIPEAEGLALDLAKEPAKPPS